jgi:molecular chaperone GrpE
MKKDNEINNEKAHEPTPEPVRAEQAEQAKKEDDTCQCHANGKQEDYQALWANYVRACADFENSRKRWERERQDSLKFGNVMLLRELLVVLDEMAQALKIVKVHKDSVEIVKGLEMMYNSFLAILKKQGLSVIETAGKKFDPHFHEIVATREVDNVEEPMILEEIQRGYFLEDKVLRASKVIVGISPQSTDHGQQTAEEKAPPEDSSGPKKEGGMKIDGLLVIVPFLICSMSVSGIHKIGQSDKKYHTHSEQAYEIPLVI